MKKILVRDLKESHCRAERIHHKRKQAKELEVILNNKLDWKINMSEATESRNLR